MVEPAQLESTILEFRHKSFSFEGRLEVHDQPWVVFARSETESESKFRPRVVRLRVLVPVAWVHADPAGELLLLGREGAPGLSPPSGPALEVAAEPDEFEEQGIDWVRWRPRPERLLYMPTELAGALRKLPEVERLGTTV
ncbi:MAG: hypothetical protein L3K13_06715 [Thermoplasmata archaeon]|nr:hypothetical protein [Thermoplasmata archaeon]